ncbi:hypothetical protein T08_4008 [Trichinella sp. T8]|nr:hypothetical protein T08_4008 [Trichinella sp. T8]
MPLTNIVRVSRHITYVGKGDLIQWKNQQEFHSSKTYAISSYPKLKSEKLTLGNHHSLYWLATAVVKIPFYFKIRVCPVYIGSDGANKRCFLHFYPSELTVD